MARRSGGASREAVPAARVILYVATIGAVALAARSVLVRPLPLAVALGAIAVYLALVAVGVVVLRLGMFVDAAWRGPTGARGVALTFDDGPSPEHTPRVLDMLEEAGVKATFFLIGRKVDAHPEVARDIVARGHAVGVHGYTHDRFLSLRSPSTVRADLLRAIEAVQRATGERPWMFRPPIGATSPRLAKAVDDLGLTVVGWSARALDGIASARAEAVAARVVPRLRDGAIVLMHDAAERDDHVPASLEALPRVLSAMRRKDLEGVRVDAWIEADPAPRGSAT